jgi:hypothetical protein
MEDGAILDPPFSILDLANSIASLQLELAYGVWLIAYGSLRQTIRHKLLAICVPFNSYEEHNKLFR